MKKGKCIIFSLTALLVGAALGVGGTFGILTLADKKEYKPFQNVTAETIDEISVCAYDTDFPISVFDNDTALRLANRLRELTFTGKGTEDYKHYVDEQTDRIKIILTNGEVFKLTPCRDYAIINGKAYSADAETLKEIAELRYDAFDSFYPFAQLNAESVKKLSVTNRGSEDTLHQLTDEEASEVIKTLQKVRAFGKEAERNVLYDGGAYPQYVIETDRGTLKITAHSILELNGKQYRLWEEDVDAAQYTEESKALDDFYWEKTKEIW